MNNTVAEIAQIFLADRRPILMVDTCSLLDIIRSPMRNSVHTHVEAAKQLVEDLNNQRIWLVLTSTVFDEYTRNSAVVKTEIERHIRRIEVDGKSINGALTLMDLPMPIDPLVFGHAALIFELERLVDDLLALGYHIDRDNNVTEKAVQREGGKIAPSQKSGQFRDCLILEHFLALATQLRGQGYLEKMTFITNNSNDYGPAPIALSPIDTEFAALNIAYNSDFNWALGTIYLP